MFDRWAEEAGIDKKDLQSAVIAFFGIVMALTIVVVRVISRL